MIEIVPGQKYKYTDKSEEKTIEVMNYIDNVVYKHYTVDEAGKLSYGKPEEVSLNTFEALVKSGYFRRIGETS